MAKAIGKREEAEKYAKLADAIKATFMEKFVKEDGSILESSQTGFALAFSMGLVPEAKRQVAMEKFIGEIEKFKWHLSSGFVGTVRLLPALSAAGRNDVAYRLFLTDTFPSWLYQVKLGATTMWERWDGWTPEKGFQDPGMNSFNHYAFGSVGNWMYNTIAGINAGSPGFKKIILKPQPGEGLSFAKAKYESIRGTIASEWKRDGEMMRFNFTVPVNTTATAYVPAGDPAKVTESGKPAGEAAGVKFVSSQDGAQVYDLQSGTYAFEVK
jgi:alpha-L-rhamnosidase